MVEKIMNNTTPYGKIRASHEGSLHSSTLITFMFNDLWWNLTYYSRLALCIYKKINIVYIFNLFSIYVT